MSTSLAFAPGPAHAAVAKGIDFAAGSLANIASTTKGKSLVPLIKEENDRFALYPTQNIYTFILLDQVDGRTWQVQWSIDTYSRGVIPIK